MDKYIHIHLTCLNQEEADKIADTLLVKQLVACAKQVPVKSSFRWQGKIEQAEEILLIMESREDLFDRVETEVTRLHSYDTFVLEAIPIKKITADAAGWVENELIND